MSNINRPNHWHRAVLFVLMASTCLFVAHTSALAQEDPAADNSSSSSSGPYAELRKSKDRSTQLLVDRYFSLVRTQEWSDKDGKKVVAKYKSHDPNLQWVKLEVARGRGADRSVKDYQLPLARLSKASQSRVKQIAAVQKRLDAELAKPADDGTATDAGAPMVDEVGEEPRRSTGPEGATEPEAPATTEAASAPVEQPAPARPAATDEPFDPDPLGFGEMDLGTSAVPPEAGAAIPPTVPESPPASGVSDPTAGGMQAKLLDSAPWRRDYNAFRASFQVENSQSVPRVSWGELTSLKEACGEVLKWEATGSVGEKEAAEIKKKFDAVGEVIWEATLTDAELEDLDWTDRINLPPLPEPMTIAFFLDEERGAGDFQNLKPGDRVRFIGRFVGFVGGADNWGDLEVAIRFPPQQ